MQSSYFKPHEEHWLSDLSDLTSHRLLANGSLKWCLESKFHSVLLDYLTSPKSKEMFPTISSLLFPGPLAYFDCRSVKYWIIHAIVVSDKLLISSLIDNFSFPEQRFRSAGQTKVKDLLRIRSLGVINMCMCMHMRTPFIPTDHHSTLWPTLINDDVILTDKHTTKSVGIPFTIAAVWCRIMYRIVSVSFTHKRNLWGKETAINHSYLVSRSVKMLVSLLSGHARNKTSNPVNFWQISDSLT